MISPALSRLFAIFIVLNIGGFKCDNSPKNNSVLQEVASDLEGRPVDLNQIVRALSTTMKEIERINKRLTVSEETNQNLTEGIAFLRLEIKNLSSVIYPERQTATPRLAVNFTETDKTSTRNHSISEASHQVQVENSTREIDAKETPTQATLQNLKIKIDSFAQKESPFVLDASTLSDCRGIIAFEEKEIFSGKRRFWVLENAGEMRFTLEKNELQSDSRVTISGFRTTVKRDFADHLEEVYINSSTPNGTEFTVSGVAILVTLTSDHIDGKELASSFAFSFVQKRNDSVLIPGRILYPSSFVTVEGRALASFPENNAKNYSNNANHLMIISRPSGRYFNPLQTFQDIENKDYYRAFDIRDDPEKTWLMYFGAWSGRDGRVNSNWGQWSTLVLFFSSDGSGTGKGYEFTIE